MCVQILYGVPVPQSAIPRLLALAGKLAPGSVNVLVDNAEAFDQFYERVAAEASPQPGAQIGVFIKIDTGYHRAGIATSSPKFAPLVQAVVGKSRQGVTSLRGFYSHFGHSYAGSSEDDAVDGLMEELVGLEKACEAVPATHTDRLVLTVGATPTATAAQNLLGGSSTRKQEFNELLMRLKMKHTVELHAGVYPLLDCQQVATQARPSAGSLAAGFQPLAKDSIAIRALVEVTSVYDERDKPEALVSAGSLAMGREPCKSYPGWGIVTDALGNKDCQSVYEENGGRTGWIVGRISQEHGILTWEGDRSKMSALSIGDKVSIWPNHACVAGAGFGWYLVVDSENGGDEVVDVWVRWRGW
jgi:D-serine deaminase-like pyridoxal phosphate-dependent protein